MNLLFRWFKKGELPRSRSNRGAIVTGALIVTGVLMIAVGAAKGLGTEWSKVKLVDFFSWLVAIILQIPLAIANVFFSVSLYFLSIVTNPDFISLSFTRLDNPVIAAGWTMTRDLANVGIILALVFIGLATILQLEGYRAKKVLPTLIAVALLINFTPVILGLVVDAANILMDFLLKDFTGSALGVFSQVFKDQHDMVWDLWKSAAGSSEGISFSPMGGTVVLLIFAITGTVIFTLFSILFIMRYVAIWMAVILSPLAFLAYVLPATKPLFKRWLNFFIQWCFVGVIAAFFLYLSKILVGAAREGLITGDVPGARQEIGGGVIDTFLPYMVIIGFLIIGFIATLTINAAGSKQVIAGVSKNYKKLGKGAWGGIKNRTIRTAPVRKAAGGVVRAAQAVPGLRYAIPQQLRELAETKPTLKRHQKEIDFMNSKNIAEASMSGEGKFRRIAKSPWVKEKSTAGLLTALSRGDADDWLDVAQERYKANDTTELFENKNFRKDTAELLKVAKRGGELNAVLRGDPRFAKIAAEEGVLKTANPEEAIQKAVGEARGQHISQWEPGVLKDPDVIEAAMGSFDRDRWLQINRSVKGGQDAAHEGMRNAYNKFLKTGGLKDNKESQDKYIKHIKDLNKNNNTRFFDAIEDKRMQQTGWKKPWDQTAAPETPATGMLLTPGAQFDIEREKGRKKKPQNVSEVEKVKKKDEARPKKMREVIREGKKKRKK